ncbi:substrate-binding domain-containing protein [Pseudoalteromonas fenneropenaei]
MQKLFAIWLLCFTYCVTASEMKTQVIFINPGYADTNPTGPFWQSVSTVMTSAALDLSINLDIRYANRDHILMKQLVLQALNEQPDYLIVVDEKSVITKILLQSKANKTQLYFLLNRPSSIELERLRSKGYQIAGSVVADNLKVGKALMEEMLRRSQIHNGTLFALLGDEVTPSSVDRERGLLSVANKQYNLKLREKLYANWSEPEAYHLILGLAQRYPDLVMIWSANDAMAAGAARALTKLGIRDKIVVGGINWDPQAQLLDVSFGGHMLLGAKSLINIFNLVHELHEPNTHQTLNIFDARDEKYLELLKHIPTDGLKAVDFLKFTESASSPLSFTLSNIVQELSLRTSND